MTLFPVCVSPLPAAEPLLGVGRASPHVPRLSFTAFVWPVFCASLEAAQASPVTIAARTRHATADTSTGESLTFFSCVVRDLTSDDMRDRYISE